MASNVANHDLSQMRVNYSDGTDHLDDLQESWLAQGWLALFRRWMDDAYNAGISEPNAMVLATVENGCPTTRSVLCKSIHDDGVIFFTNYHSDKGIQLATVPYASVTFPWYLISRQIHIRGHVTQLDPQSNAQYWASRPRGSQVGAWASHQSQPIESREQLVKQFEQTKKRFENIDAIPCPPYWGGYRISPEVVEFWQGRNNRLHNRIRVTGGHIQRLQP